MMSDPIPALVLLGIGAAAGLTFLLSAVVGIVRFVGETIFRQPTAEGTHALTPADVAVIIPAHNEELSLPACIQAISRIVPPEQIHVVSDGSTDRTAEIARGYGCNVVELLPGRGKARALQHAVEAFRLCERYEAVLIQDADAEIDPEYLRHALPLFDDPEVVVVAGHVLSRWPKQSGLHLHDFITAYRTRLYRLQQAIFQYALSWRRLSLSYIAPGFCSMYRTSILPQIDIAAQGLVIEDFNMTFETQHKRLGRIAYTPHARCSSEDPYRLQDYVKQIRRWYLGFWQTVRRHGIWPGKFWLALATLLGELLFFNVFLIGLVALSLASLLFDIDIIVFSVQTLSIEQVSPLQVLLAFAAADCLLTVIVSLVERRPALMFFGIAFPLLRIVDAALFLMALYASFSTRSDGRWISPTRRGTMATAGTTS